MHEMSIAVEIMRQLQELTDERSLSKIEKVVVSAGQIRQIVPDALSAAFDAVTKNTSAQGASISIETVPIEANCLSCDLTFNAAIDDYICPRCKQANVKIIKGNEIILSSVTCIEKTPSVDE